MRVFVTGATGFIGSAVVQELQGAGHQVVGLARSDSSADALAAAGAEVHRGSLEDLDSLRAGAEASDGVIHLGYIHDFSKMEENARVDRTAIETLGDALAGSDRPLVIASGTLLVAPPGQTATEADAGVPAGDAVGGRRQNEQVLLAFADRGVRSASIRLTPTVHGAGDHGFVPIMIGVAREKGVSGYVGDGRARWPAVHRLDAARLFRLALENAPAGTVLHAVAEEGVPVGEIAEVIGRHLGVPVESISPEGAFEHFGFLGALLGLDSPASSVLTRESFAWWPEQPGLIEDLDQGHYFKTAAPVAS
ncbi:MAG TPA: SDR family oxidoreductase [Solirubrobacteraceae bacterium]|jgi:nucleoside-diphosphate-sugar epimerase|nr:SDR family oxidoreductase [Solirubrobacteraceae bacterium]